jgi:hypothetical protein
MNAGYGWTEGEMLELVHEYPDVIRDGSAAAYHARAYAEREENGHWGGYLIFVPAAGGRVVATDRETTQATFEAVDHWAGTLSWVYLEGALTRALERQPEVQLSKRLTEIERAEETARAHAEALEQAAALAREEAADAHEEREVTGRQLAEAAARAAEAEAAFHEKAAERARELASTLKEPETRAPRGRKRSSETREK